MRQHMQGRIRIIRLSSERYFICCVKIRKYSLSHMLTPVQEFWQGVVKMLWTKWKIWIGALREKATWFQKVCVPFVNWKKTCMCVCKCVALEKYATSTFIFPLKEMIDGVSGFISLIIFLNKLLVVLIFLLINWAILLIRVLTHI